MSSDPACTNPVAPTRLAHEAPVVAIVGAGASGTLTAIHLLRALRARRATGTVVLIDPAARVGRGVAYGTSDEQHLLNVPASRLSALPDRPDHLRDWARRHVHPATTGADYLPRARYGEYLADTLSAEAARGEGPRVVRHRSRVVAIDREPGRRHRLHLHDGTIVGADAVVLATGVFAPGTAWAPASLLASPRFVADPWAPGALDAVARAGGDVLLVGTGLTMVDVALSVSAPRRTLHAVSRSGRLPHVHGAYPRPAVEPDLPDELDVDLAGLRRLVLDHLRRAVRRYGDWRPAIDGLRAHTARLWATLDDRSRAEFLLRDARRWELHRHRMPRRTAEAVHRLRSTGRLRVAQGEVTDVEAAADALLVHLSDGSTCRVGHVVNCTGPQADVTRAGDPLLDQLLAQGRAVPDRLGLGIVTDPDGRVVAADGTAGSLWTLGALRRGQLWESSAVPEIRAQACTVAGQLADRLAAPRPRPRPRPARDLHGLAISTDAAAAAAYNTGLGRVLRVQGGAEEAFRESVALDPSFALGHAALALLGHEGGGGVDVAASLAAAQESVRRRGDNRERSLVEVVTARVRDCRGAGAAALVGHIRAHPRDALAVSAAVPTIAFSGVTDVQQEAWELVESLAPAYGDDWWYHGLLAFVRQDQGRYDEADALSAAALHAEPASGHAVHARTHVYYETGQHLAGLRWLDPWIETSGRAASHRAHFSWHAALHELSLGRLDELHRRYQTQLAPPNVTGVRALVDSASLLWRCRLTGAWDGELPLASVLERVGAHLLERPATPFTAMHAALALTATGDVAALARLRAHAFASSDPVMSDIVASLCDALIAVADERWAEAVRILRLLGPWLVQLGGSAAQREIVEETLLHALVGAGRCDEARVLLEARLDRRPSPLDRRRLAAVPA